MFPSRLMCLIGIMCCSIAPAQQLAFDLPSVAGRLSVAPDQAAATVVCFLGTECPMARSYAPLLNEMQQAYRAQNVRIVGVFSNRQDSLSELASYVEDLQVSFEVAHDVGNVVADRYAATRTPEAFLLDRQLKLRYHGRIDDRLSPGVTRSAASRQDLREALDSLLAGKPVAIPETKALGCVIGKVRSPATTAIDMGVTYCSDIAAILQRNCVECHRAGEIGPFAMQEYGEVVGWAETMLETIENGRMPPWHAAPGNAPLANARHMSEEDKQLFAQWVAAGLPKGDERELPPPLEFTAGWQLERVPDRVVAMRERPFIVPKDGTVEYQYFVVDLDLEQDVWISAAQVIPGSRAAVHHAAVFVRPPDGSAFRGIGWLTAYVPGQRIRPLPPGRARKIPAGSKLVFQMHYTPVGVEQSDITRVGLLFADPASVTHEVYTTVGIDQDFEIPPHNEEYLVQAKVNRLPADGQVLAVTPHMHFRGKSFELFAGEQRQTLLSVPNYDFNWQHTYEFADPLNVDQLDSLSFEMSFDNSASNPFNPDDSQWVTWGDQTWEEMAVAFFEVSEPLVKSSAIGGQPGQSPASQTPAADANDARQQNIEHYIADVLRELDQNADGVIRRRETSIVLRRWNFEFWDTNGDDSITVEELRTKAERLYPADAK